MDDHDVLFGLFDPEFNARCYSVSMPPPFMHNVFALDPWIDKTNTDALKKSEKRFVKVPPLQPSDLFEKTAEVYYIYFACFFVIF